MLKRILFVCTGNTCRSPMAEAMLRQLAQEAELDIEARSAGVIAVGGSPISKHARKILTDKGIEPSVASRALDRDLIDWADLVLTMTVHHKRNVLEQFPEAVDKTQALKEYIYDDPEILDMLQERERLMTELQLKITLRQPIAEEEKTKLYELEQRLPSFDIIDPFGGSFALYLNCAEEIGNCVTALVDKLRKANTER